MLRSSLSDMDRYLTEFLATALGSVDIHAMARKAAERWMKAQKLVSVLS
jgi:hypothetical protein